MSFSTVTFVSMGAALVGFGAYGLFKAFAADFDRTPL